MELGAVMKAAARNIPGHFRFGAAKLLVIAQVALSLIVIFGAALFARSLRNLAKVELGYDRQHVLSVWIDPRSAGYDAAKLPVLYQRLVDRTEAIPGVRSAAMSMCALAVDCRTVIGDVKISGYEPAPHEEIRIQAGFVGPDYFATVGMRLLNGRDFQTSDTGTRFAVANQALVRRYFANRSPLGQRFGDHLESEIVGIVGDARMNRVREEPAPTAFYPLKGNLVYAESMEVRASGDPNAIAADVRKAVNDVAPDLPMERITPLALQVDRSLSCGAHGQRRYHCVRNSGSGAGVFRTLRRDVLRSFPANIGDWSANGVGGEP
jgi:hypothetical protein